MNTPYEPRPAGGDPLPTLLSFTQASRKKGRRDRVRDLVTEWANESDD
jgi:hypothetical protein